MKDASVQTCIGPAINDLRCDLEWPWTCCMQILDKVRAGFNVMKNCADQQPWMPLNVCLWLSLGVTLNMLYTGLSNKVRTDFDIMNYFAVHACVHPADSDFGCPWIRPWTWLWMWPLMTLNVLYTGLSDEVRADFNVMKDLAVHTRIGPADRVKRLQRFIDDVSRSVLTNRLFTRWSWFDERWLSLLDELVNMYGLNCHGSPSQLFTVLDKLAWLIKLALLCKQDMSFRCCHCFQPLHFTVVLQSCHACFCCFYQLKLAWLWANEW